jgi:HAD superfamily hydrolase (TIGR01549 family)
MYDDALDSIDRLRTKGYLVTVASNFDARLRRILGEMDVLDRFDEVLISSDLGWSKPNTEFYHTAAIRIGADDPSKLLMIGDTHQGDVIAARQAGWDARHLVRDQDRALSELTKDL